VVNVNLHCVGELIFFQATLQFPQKWQDFSFHCKFTIFHIAVALLCILNSKITQPNSLLRSRIDLGVKLIGKL